MKKRIPDIRAISSGCAVDRTSLIVPMLVVAASCSTARDDGEAVGDTTQALTSGHIYNLGTLAHPGSCMDVTSAGTADGTNIQEWTCNGTAAQAFQLQAIDSTWFKLVNTSSGKCIDATSNGTADGTNIQLWTCNGTGAQAWRFVPSGSFFTLVGQTSNKCIDVKDGGTADGTNIQLWTCNGTTKQNWNLTDITSGGGDDGGGASFSGFASFNIYDGVPASSVFCNLDPNQFGMMVTALRTDLADAYAATHGRSACGLCARVTSSGRTVTAHIIDHSNDFTNNGGKRDLDLSVQAFQSIGSLDSGVIPVDFSIGACP